MSAPAGSRNRPGSLSGRIALAPYTVWAALFILVPLVFIAYYAFTDNDFRFTLDNITKFFTATSSLTRADGTAKEVHTYLVIFWRSVKLAVISTAICLVLGYPVAYIIAHARPRAQKIMITLIMIPMWMNFLIRTYSWITILSNTGLINTFLQKIGLIDKPIKLLLTPGAVILGMVYDYIPYMILPIYSVMSKLDKSLLEAAEDLGSNSFTKFKRVIFPLTKPGVISGITMVFVPSVSTFYISQKLGGTKTMLIGDTIEYFFNSGPEHYNIASAISMVLMVMILICLFIMNRFSDSDDGGVLM